MNKYAIWIGIALQVLIIVGGILAFIFALPSKDYIDSKIDSLERNLASDIKELQDDVDQLIKTILTTLLIISANFVATP